MDWRDIVFRNVWVFDMSLHSTDRLLPSKCEKYDFLAKKKPRFEDLQRSTPCSKNLKTKKLNNREQKNLPRILVKNSESFDTPKFTPRGVGGWRG